MNVIRPALLAAIAVYAALVATCAPTAAQQQKRPNIVMLMTDDTGWGDFGYMGGGKALGHPTPNIDRIAREGAIFTNWLDDRFHESCHNEGIHLVFPAPI
jgi:hypothetical protein